MVALRKGSRGSLVKTLQRGLAHLGYHPGGADGVYGPVTAARVADFQARVRLYDDGIFGPATAGAYNDRVPFELRIALITVSSIHVDAGDRLALTRRKADYIPKRSLRTIKLREDCGRAYDELVADVHELGGKVTTAGGLRGLTPKGKKIGSAQSRTSFHYLGRAFDLGLPSGMQDKGIETFEITRDGPRHWVVWCHAPGAPEVTLDAVRVSGFRDKRGRRRTQIHTDTITGHFVNFTDLADVHGFARIGARRSFLRGGSYSGAEWWHFSWLEGLTGRPTYGDELRRIYPLHKCRNFVFWDDVKDLQYNGRGGWG